MIENITDQLLGFTQEVRYVIEYIKKEGYTTEEAIKIVELGVKDIEVETKHQFNRQMENFINVLNSLTINE